MKLQYLAIFSLVCSNPLLGTTTGYSSADYQPLSAKKLVQVHLITRHGVRYPTLDNFQAHLDIVQQIQSSPAINSTIDLNYGPLSNAGMLHPSGKQSVQSYGQRFQARYSSLLDDPSKFFTSSSNVPRVLDTASSFFIGMKGTELPNGVIQDRTLDADNDMNKSCKKYVSLPKNKKEASTFEKEYLPNLADKLNNKLDMELNTTQASTLLDACAFQIAFGMNPNESFCSQFDSDDFSNYQLNDDFSKFYTLSYGLDAPFNSQLGCSLVTDIYNNINNQSLTASFHFGHAETIIPLITSLGLLRDSQLLTTQSPNLADRKFKTGLFAPMQANLVFEVYENNDLRLVLNEAPIDIPGCTDSTGLCAFNKFLEIYHNVVGCDFDSICENASTTIGGSNGNTN
ncbi:PHOsphatase [Boothiomyces macroporosus]|uniref:Multiple inositol polyphosphate phosphatase 1 n=1 Tax=Boothiomyces macroporosus TaxID=261099 RepID=A0AAD5Y3J6_9FUNG|nr:PHOsphatase [Boothiomyces macroporosus]